MMSAPYLNMVICMLKLYHVINSIIVGRTVQNDYISIILEPRGHNVHMNLRVYGTEMSLPYCCTDEDYRVFLDTYLYYLFFLTGEIVRTR